MSRLKRMYGARRAHAARVAVAAALLVTSLTPLARADDEEEARAAMRRGVAAFGRGEAESALREYEAAKRLAPAANAPYRYAAEALVALARHREAVENFETYLAKNPRVSDASDVRTRIHELRTKHLPARLTVRVDAPEAVVVIDTREPGAPGTFELAPGKHHIEARAPGRAPIGQDVTLVGDRDTTVVLAPPVSVASSAANEGHPGAEEAAPLPWRAAGWVTLGASAATLVTMAVLDAAVLGPRVADYEQAADRGDPRARELRDGASGLQTGVLVGYVAGGLLAAAGGAMIVLAPRPLPGGAHAQIVPTWSPSFAGLTTRLTF